MYTLYIANRNYSSWSLRPWVLMRELGIPFEERLVPFKSCAFRDFSPSGKVPCLVDGSTTVWDSLAITEYLAERHSGVWPADPVARAWARSVAAEMHSGFRELRIRFAMNCGARIRLKELSPALQQDIDRMDELWSEGIKRFGGPFLAGSTFGAVDAFFAPVAFRVLSYDIQLGAVAADYAKRLLALSSMQHWYAQALQEPWRVDAYEEDARQNGIWLEDLRATPGK